jgi:hypothetical protein
MNINKYIQTKHLEAMILSDNSMKLSIYNSYHSPYGYDKRDLIVRHFGVQPKEFTYKYVSNKVDEVYSTFNKDEVHELITKVNKYKNG